MTKASSSKYLEDMLECSICTEELKNPRVLPCIHTFCLKCLENTGRSNRPGDNLICPLCRRDFKVPDTGIVGFQKNFFIEKLIDLHRLSTCDSEKTCCDVCSSDSNIQTDIPLAVMYCIDCSQQLCENCRLSHEKMELNKSHQLIDLKDKVKINKLARNTTWCDFHKNKPIEMFCFDCKSSNCVICQLESHQGHKCSSVDKVGEDLRIQLDTVVMSLSKLLDFSKKETEKLDENDRILSEKCLKLRQDVEQTGSTCRGSTCSEVDVRN